MFQWNRTVDMWHSLMVSLCPWECLWLACLLCIHCSELLGLFAESNEEDPSQTPSSWENERVLFPVRLVHHLPIKLHWLISVHYGFMLCQLEQRDPDMFLSCSGLCWQIWAFWSCCWLAKGWLHYWMYQHLVQDDFTNFNNLGIAVEGALCLPVAVLFGFFVTDFREHSECRKCIGCQCLLECVALTSTHWLVVELLGPVFGGLTGPHVFWNIDWLWLWCHHSDTWDKIFIVVCNYWVILSW